MHREILCLASFIILASILAHSQPAVPSSIEYCGIQLILTDDAKAQIEGYVNKIHESPRYFNEMVKRAHIYMPFIREAFANVQIPHDLAYLAIQESSLRSDVVSKADAVGFWQFKAGAAKDFGLRVNDKVDERKHIYRSSEAAAMYLASANEDFDNWLYAVLAYYHGMTGAVEHTDPTFYGKDTMTITTDLHWYVLKAIAHKIAYEEALSKHERPLIALYPFSSEGMVEIKTIIEKHQVNRDDFLFYNKWIRDDKKLPRNELFTYYIPLRSEYYVGHMPDPNKVRGGGAPIFLASNEEYIAGSTNADNLALNYLYGPEDQTPVTKAVDEKETQPGAYSYSESKKEIQKDPASFHKSLFPDSPKAEKSENLSEALFAEFQLTLDLHYGVQYVIYDGHKTIVDIAKTYDMKLGDVLVWNGLLPGEIPKLGMIIYLKKPSKTSFHVTRYGESLSSIAARHFMSEEKLIKLNRLNEYPISLYEGQKLYLKQKRPLGEKVIILKEDVSDLKLALPLAESDQRTSEAEGTETVDYSMKTRMVGIANQEIEGKRKEDPKPIPSQNQDSAIREVKTHWISHTVSAGESLWEISQKYGTKVEIIKVINKLANDDISEGTTLRILAKEDLAGK